MARLPLALRLEALPYSTRFEGALQSYCEPLDGAASRKKHPDHRGNLLMDQVSLGGSCIS
jgi:hypothetical protein